MSRIRQKWRPSMALVVALICVALVSIPLAAMMTVQLTSNQFIRETELALHKQAAIYAEVYRSRFEALDGAEIGATPTEEQLQFWDAPVHPLLPQLNIRHDQVLPSLPDGKDGVPHADPRHNNVLAQMQALAKAAGKTTLAGAIFLDHQGVGRGEAGLRDFSSLPEVQSALSGKVGVTLRARGDDYRRHPLESLSRDTGYRVFVAFPVLSNARVIGVVLLSRTPLNLSKYLYRERDAMVIMALFTFVGALGLGILLLRLMSRPVRGLRDEARTIAAGGKPNAEPLHHYGIRELADLGESMLSMADTLERRSKEIATYTDHVTHELKSPVTAIVGAAELLEDPEINAENRAKLLGNIHTEGRRMNQLLTQLRQMTQLRQEGQRGPGQLSVICPELDGLAVDIEQPSEDALPLSNAHGEIILLQMAQNARAHGATRLWLQHQNGVLTIRDNGEGLPEADLSRLADPFFTTRRDQGGTGMGLAIVAALLEGYGAKLRALPGTGGAHFEIQFKGSARQ